jgi:hypothetical protein
MPSVANGQHGCATRTGPQQNVQTATKERAIVEGPSYGLFSPSSIGGDILGSKPYSNELGESEHDGSRIENNFYRTYPPLQARTEMP